MTGLGALIRRDMKLYFKDKGMFFSSLITPILLLVLYTTFLKKVFDDSFRSALEAAGATVADSVLNGVVGGQLISSLLAVSCVTVAFCSNLLMIKDKTSGARHDLTISPVRPSTMAMGYYLASLLSTLIITFTAAAVCGVSGLRGLVPHGGRCAGAAAGCVFADHVWYGAFLLHQLLAHY